ncbi:MAG: LptF/LptG family permease [Candidatus Omnitrophica bacterium]|nr:LptF/LptG family permease [Candidatus Omnitrophota bacterium]
MRILDRYVLRSVLSIFLTCLLTFVFLYIVIDVISSLEDILKQKVGLLILIKYYLSYLPIIFVQVSPFSCLLATLYAFGKLNRDNELVAMRSAGLSIFQIARTVIIFGALVSFFVFLVNDRLVPASVILTKKIREQIESGTKKSRDKEHQDIINLAMYGLKNRLFFVNKFSPATDTMEGIIILQQDPQQNITKKIVANKGVYKDGVWVFYRSITYDLDTTGQIIGEPHYFDEEVMDITETPADFLTQRQNPDSMTIGQINDYLDKLTHSGATTVIRNLKVDLYRKFTEPLTAFMIILLGIPFSLKIKRRAAGLASFGLAIIMGFLYYVLNAVGIALGKGGIIFPAVAVSLSHIAAFITGIYLIRSLP